jgi:hypothetical protein
VSAGPYNIPFNFLAMTPLLTITTGSSTLQATILTEDGSIGQQVGVFSLDYSSVVQDGFGFDFFGYLNGDGSPSNKVFGVGPGPQLYTDLQSPFFGSGGQNVSEFNTSVGLFVMTDSTDQGATFTVSGGSPSAVPEIDPNSLGSVLALVLGSLGLLERRRLKAA